ncbi:MAG: F0F1 ATP synthase subunit epsilon, partial [Deltaproteobacteria bacterium]|nr:F0F1 ATP synthase subunit epsilon [Deltaproteobacteria bacterium]
PEHLPLTTTMESGVLQFERGGKTVKLAVHYGYASVSEDAITVLSEMVEKGEEIDLERARGAESKARVELQKLISEQGAEEHLMNKYEAKLKRAIIRQQASH